MINDIRIFNLVHYLRSFNAFSFGIYCGIISVALDADHLLTFIWPEEFGARPFHKIAFLVAGIVAIGCVACIGRLWIRMVLRRSREKC